MRREPDRDARAVPEDRHHGGDVRQADSSPTPAGQYNYLQGGNPALTPETAKSTTLGVVLTPTRNLSASVDYFEIKVDNQVGIVPPPTILTQCLNCGRVLRPDPSRLAGYAVADAASSPPQPEPGRVRRRPASTSRSTTPTRSRTLGQPRLQLRRHVAEGIQADTGSGTGRIRLRRPLRTGLRHADPGMAAQGARDLEDAVERRPRADLAPHRQGEDRQQQQQSAAHWRLRRGRQGAGGAGLLRPRCVVERHQAAHDLAAASTTCSTRIRRSSPRRSRARPSATATPIRRCTTRWAASCSSASSTVLT